MSAAKAKKKAPQTFEVVFNESGAMRRVPVQQAAPTGVSAPPRPAIVTAAVTASADAARRAAPPPPPEENELVFGESGEILTGEARAKALAEARPAVEEEEEELVFGENGQILTGEARAAALRAVAEQNRRNKEAAEAAKRASAAAASAKKPRKLFQSKGAKQIGEVDDIEKMKLFYRYRAKYPNFFVYTPEGNLQVIDGNAAKIPPMTIPLRAFSELRTEELQEIEAAQEEAQKGIETTYTTKLKELRQAYDAYDARDPASVALIVRLNTEVRDMSILRARTLYPEEWTKEIESIDTRDILLNLPYEERKIGYPVYLFKRFSLARKDAEGHYREHGAAEEEGMEGGGTVVLFLTNPEDPKTGHFHPAAEREFVFNETRYVSPYQAYEAERFKEFEDEDMVKRLLGTRSAKTIRNLVSGEQRQPSFPIKLWEEILESFYTQFKDAAERLKGTGSARFHMMDKLIGSPEYANALANVRTKLKEHENDAPGMVDEVKMSVITEDQQKKDKVGAIVNNFRKRPF